MQRDKDLVPRFWFCLLFTFPFFVRTLEPFYQWVLASIVLVVGGWSFYRHAWNMPKSIYTLFCMSLSVLYLYSLLEGLLSTQPTFYYSNVASVTTLILLQQILADTLLEKADSALGALVGVTPKKAHKLLIDGRSEVVDAGVLKDGDTVRVAAGELVPIDGVLFSGDADVQEYGQVVHKVIGSPIYAGTINLKGTCLVRATSELASSIHAQRIEIAKRQHDSASEQTILLFIIAAWGLSIVALLLWSLLSGLGDAVLAMSALSLALCPAALVLSDALTKKMAVGEAITHGIVIRSFKVFEEVARATMLVVNKNGTLTVGKPSIVSIDHVEGVSADDMLQVAASLESSSIHPYAHCIVEKANSLNIPVLEAEGLEEVSGLGVRGKIQGEVCQIGDEKLLGHIDLSFYKNRAEDMRKQGYIVLFCAKGHKLLGILVLSDPVRSDVRNTLTAFKNEGLLLFCLSGDRRITVIQLVGALGFDRFQSEAPAQQKIYTIQKLQKEGRSIFMVGDPQKDEAALVQANAGAALGSRGNLLVEKSPITLLQSNLSSALTLFSLSKQVGSIDVQNRIFSIASMILLALFALFGAMGPNTTAIYMVVCSIVVGLNVLRIQKTN